MAHLRVDVTGRFVEAMRFLDPADRAEARRLVGVIQIDPAPDNVNKIVLLRPPAVFYAYVTDRLWIAYHVAGDLITFWNVGTAKASAPVPW